MLGKTSSITASFEQWAHLYDIVSVATSTVADSGPGSFDVERHRTFG